NTTLNDVLNRVNQKMRLAITGGMGCGKSEVSRILREHQWGTADADALVHQLFESDISLRQVLVERFGSESVDISGQVNRAYLASRVFNDPEALAVLESLTHPRVEAAWDRLTESQPNQNWAIEIPLLFEKNLATRFDYTVCVACAETTQRARLKSRGWSEAMVESRLKNQWPLKNKIELAHFVLLNDGDVGFLQKQVEELLRRLGVS
ncbi:MAG TPA: dephospho-CoA kinase, partial [Opitutales bacterium]|nr:dephospho-CoA kinase [Opitutales bacterium]